MSIFSRGNKITLDKLPFDSLTDLKNKIED